MRRTKEEATRTRQDLLDAALTVFSEKGYAAARLQDIATAAGTTRGAIYHHFQNKVGLYSALLESAAGQSIVTIQEAIDEGGSFSDICQQIMVMSFELLAADTHFRQVMTLTLFKTGVSAELSHLEAARTQQAADIITSIAHFMQSGIDSGDLRSDTSPENLARAFLAYQNGLMTLWLTNPTPFSIATEAPVFADLFMNGISSTQKS